MSESRYSSGRVLYQAWKAAQCCPCCGLMLEPLVGEPRAQVSALPLLPRETSMLSQAQEEAREAAGLVGCDDATCQAKDEPVTFEDYRVAYEHWRRHSHYSGCSHGC